METKQEQTFEHWAIVELFGHSRLAGKVTEAEIGAGTLVRVDVPADSGPGFAFTKYIGTKAIYAINIVSEPIARQAAKRFEVRPVYGYELPALESPGRQEAPWPGEQDDNQDMPL